MATVREIMRRWLDEHDADGLLNMDDQCCCTTDSDDPLAGFMRCAGRDCSGCVPGHVESRFGCGNMVAGPRPEACDA